MSTERERPGMGDLAAPGVSIEEASDEICLVYGPDANPTTVSEYAAGVIRDILRRAGASSARITSTARTACDQARAMYQNLELKGVAHQKRLYGHTGDQVIGAYVRAKRAGKTEDEIRQAMEDEINAIGPRRVSRHCADPEVMVVVDIAPSSIEDHKAFLRAAKSDRRVSTCLHPPRDPAFHLEIPNKR